MCEKEKMSLVLIFKNTSSYYSEIIRIIQEKYHSSENKDEKPLLNIVLLQQALQYIEAIGARCVACEKGPYAEFIEVFVKYNPDLINNFYQKAHKLSYDDLTTILSYHYDSYWPEDIDKDEIHKRINKSIKVLKECLIKFAKFWKEYHNLYNATKHGGRYWIIEAIYKPTGELRYGIQWIKNDHSFDERFISADEIVDTVDSIRKCGEKIMKAIHSNREYSYTEKEEVNPDKYIFLDNAR